MFPNGIINRNIFSVAKATRFDMSANFNADVKINVMDIEKQTHKIGSV